MLTIGKAAGCAGLSASAMRYYERQGLLRLSRRLNGYRLYDKTAMEALRFLRQAQTLGLTLKEIRLLLEQARGGQRPCESVRELARRHLTDIDVKIRQLRSLRRELRALLSRSGVASGDSLCPLISPKLTVYKERTGCAKSTR